MEFWEFCVIVYVENVEDESKQEKEERENRENNADHPYYDEQNNERLYLDHVFVIVEN